MEEKKTKLEPEQISLLKHVFRVYDAAIYNIDMNEECAYCDASEVRDKFFKLQEDLSEILGADVKTIMVYSEL